MQTEGITTKIQSGYAQDFAEYEAPHFTWERGQRCWLETRPRSDRLVGYLAPGTEQGPVEAITQDHAVLVCDGESEKYKPLAETADAYLQFAAIPSNDGEFAQAAAQFVEQYGLPRRERIFSEAYGAPAMPLDLFLSDAVEMATAVRYLLAVQDATRRGDYRPVAALDSESAVEIEEMVGLGPRGTLLFSANWCLMELLTFHLQGVRLRPTLDAASLVQDLDSRKARGEADPSAIRILPQYSCDSLLTAMWLQVYFAATQRRIIHLRCMGCRRPFEAKDRRQKYCDPHCRHATNQRHYYGREKRKQKEARNG